MVAALPLHACVFVSASFADLRPRSSLRSSPEQWCSARSALWTHALFGWPPTVDGPCRSGGVGTRIHYSIRRKLAHDLREAGLRVEEEALLPELVVEIANGIREGCMDIVVSRPGGVSRHLVDVRSVDARAPRYASAAAGFLEASQEKARRYGNAAWAFPVEHRGRLGGPALDVLWLCAQEAALVTGMRPATLLRKWRRGIALVVAFELAEVQRSATLRTPG